jgi:hypothetical protein
MVAGIVVNYYDLKAIVRFENLIVDGLDSRCDVCAFVEGRYHY